MLMPFIRERHSIQAPIKSTRFLIKTLGFPPKLAQKTIDKARFRLPDNTPIHKSQLISGEVWLTRFVDIYPQSELLSPIFSTKDFALFDKPAKLLTHPKGTFTHKSLIDSIRHFCGTQAQPVHRLDYETSGAILVAKTRQSEKALKDLVATKQVEKLYLAKIRGILCDEILIDAPIYTPHKHARGHLSIRSCISDKGKDSRTLLTPIHIDTAHNCTYIHARPLTGRTHQIRLHCAHIGHPICGDLLYGASDCVADSYLNALKEHFHTVSLESTFSHNAAQAQKTQKLQEVDFGKKVDSRENVIFHKTAKPLESTCKNTQRAEILESTLHTSPRNTLLAQTLCLHAFSLHFCYDHTTYALSTHPPSWWLDSSEYPNGKT
ncbi:RluA family pseudouridine synthase [Helicobacter zhangjianzhongii]|uniref:RluA family pseudouridine synthase n=1 Tax=Helicobacter zhangjianzhongii TaxID=2974574 RepID=UPI002557C76E|nr:RluA family pseudouridine synthase [Helicobacter sp. CPD2-1]MDL0080303.1 RluA family pseudouridine synthase [Helicobacter sp. CPD2-1]